MRMESNAMETKRSMKQSWFFEKITKIGTPMVKVTNRKGNKTQINKIRDEMGRYYNRYH
jgi:hypothetical protein